MTKPGNSAADRLIRFFEANPDEWLTLEDMMAKLGVVEAGAREAIREAREAGANIRREIVYYYVRSE